MAARRTPLCHGDEDGTGSLPKSLEKYKPLENRYENLLWACVHCNGHKLNRDPVQKGILNPRQVAWDERFYYENFRIHPRRTTGAEAQATIRLLRLNSAEQEALRRGRQKATARLRDDADRGQVVADDYAAWGDVPPLAVDCGCPESGRKPAHLVGQTPTA